MFCRGVRRPRRSDNPSKIGGIPFDSSKNTATKATSIRLTRPGTRSGLPPCAQSKIRRPVDMAIMRYRKPSRSKRQRPARKGVKALVTLTRRRRRTRSRNQERLKAIAKDAGMRIVGPNCLGYFNPKNHIYATFSTSFTHGMPKIGNVGMVSQSGAFGSHCFVLGREKGIGFSYWVTTGNEVDVDVAECIAFMSQDPGTDVICAHIEGCEGRGAPGRSASPCV